MCGLIAVQNYHNLYLTNYYYMYSLKVGSLDTDLYDTCSVPITVERYFVLHNVCTHAGLHHLMK